MLQRLEAADRYAELRAVFRILDRLVFQGVHDPHGLRTDGQRGVVDSRVERGEAAANVTEPGRVRNADVSQ